MRERYTNLFDMYEKITGENAYRVPMRIYPAVHYTMGGSWVDYNLMSSLPGLFVVGEANFSDHGANRLGASALMQGLADGYFVLPYTIGNYFAGLGVKHEKPTTSHAEFKKAEEAVRSLNNKLLSIKGKRTVTSLHRELGKLLWEKCGMARTEAGLKEALQRIPALRAEFWKNVNVTGENGELNQNLEYAGRVADFMEFAELLCRDALHRNESCGGHFRTEFQHPDGEARRDDENFSYVGAWEYHGPDKPPALHKEPLVYEEVHMSTRKAGGIHFYDLRPNEFATRPARLPLRRGSGGLETLGKCERNLAEGRGPRGPSERERASHWAWVRWCLGFRGAKLRPLATIQIIPCCYEPDIKSLAANQRQHARPFRKPT